MVKRLLCMILFIGTCLAESNILRSDTFMDGDTLGVMWKANPDSICWYNIYYVSEETHLPYAFWGHSSKDTIATKNPYKTYGAVNKDTSSKLIYWFPRSFAENFRVYVSATNHLHVNGLYVEGPVCDTFVVFFYLKPPEPGVIQMSFGVEKLATYLGTGTLVVNGAFKRLGVFGDMQISIPIKIETSGNYDVMFFASGKSGAPRLKINDIYTKVVALGPEGGYPKPTIIHLMSGQQTIVVSVEGGDVWLWGDEALVITLLEKDLIIPGKVTSSKGLIKRRIP